MRVYRRAVTTGVIRIHEERVPDAGLVEEHIDRLRREGWKRWPPNPAPELAQVVWGDLPEYRECPYLLEVTEVGGRWLQESRLQVKCFRSLDQLSRTLALEERLRRVRRQVSPCAELRRRWAPSEHERRKALEKLCAEMRPTVKRAVAENRRLHDVDPGPSRMEILRAGGGRGAD